MGDYRSHIDSVQKKNKDLIENKLGKIAKNADEEKVKVMKSVDNVRDLT